LRRGGGEHIKIETETHRCIYNFYEIYLQSDMSTASESKKIEEKKNKKKLKKIVLSGMEIKVEGVQRIL
jgi:hypothetical protein